MRRRGTVLLGLAASAMLGLAGTSQAAVTIGSTLTAPPAINDPCAAAVPCTATNLALPASSLAPGGLVSPVNGTITSWQASTNAPNILSVSVLHPAGGITYTNTATSAPVSVGSGVTSPLATSLPIQQGDSIALQRQMDTFTFATTPGATAAQWSVLPGGPLLTGQTRTADSTLSPREVLVQATIEPTSITGSGGGVGAGATFGTIRRNKKKGTATVTVHLPNPGQLSYSGSGIKAKGPASIAAAGDVQVTVKATGKKRAKLSQKGKVGVSLTVSFTPTGGTLGKASTSFKLVKKH